MLRTVALVCLIGCLSMFSTVTAEVLLSDIGVVGAGRYVNTEEGTDLTCAKYTVTLTAGANPEVVSGVLSVEDAAEFESGTYSTVDAVVDAAISYAVPGSVCDFSQTATCTKTVTLDATKSYIGAILNHGTVNVAYSMVIESCPASPTSGANTAAPALVIISALVGALTTFA
jgi:hypothetical protein